MAAAEQPGSGDAWSWMPRCRRLKAGRRTRSATLQFAQWMAALDAEERQIMMLRYVEELEYHDIAEVLGLPLGTVQWKIFNSKKKLARRFGAT